MIRGVARRPLAVLAVILLAGAGLRAWVFLQFGDSAVDAREEGYYEQGVSLLSRGVLSQGLNDAKPRLWRGPVFPAFAALSETPFREPGPAHPRAAQHLLSLVGILFAFWLGNSVAGPCAGLAGAALVALDAGQALSANSLNVHAFYGLSLLALAGAAALWAERPDDPRGAVLGLLFGATFLTRSTHFLSFPLVLAAGAWRDDGWRRAARRTVWPLAALALALAPWAFRNAVQFRRFEPLDSQSGAVNFYTASLGERDSFEIDAAVRLAEKERPGLSGLLARDRDAVFPILLQLGVRHVLQSPLTYALASVRRGIDLYGDWWPWLLVAAFGLWSLRSRASFAAGAVGASLAAYGLIGVQPSYAGAARPLLAMLTGWGLSELARRAAGRSLPFSAGADVPAARAGAAAFAGTILAVLLLSHVFVLREPFLTGAPDAPRFPPERDGRMTALTEKFVRRAPRGAGSRELRLFVERAGPPDEVCTDFELAWRADPRDLSAGLRAARCRRGAARRHEEEAGLGAPPPDEPVVSLAGTFWNRFTDAPDAPLHAPATAPLAAAARPAADAVRSALGLAAPLSLRNALAGTDALERREAPSLRLWIPYRIWAQRLHDRGRDDEALKILDWALTERLAAASGGVRAAALTSRAALRWKTRDGTGADSDFAAALAADAEVACLHAPPLVEPADLPQRYFVECLRRFPTNSILLGDQGVALWRDGRRDEARASLRAALASDPGNRSAALSLRATLPR